MWVVARLMGRWGDDSLMWCALPAGVGVSYRAHPSCGQTATITGLNLTLEEEHLITALLILGRGWVRQSACMKYISHSAAPGSAPLFVRQSLRLGKPFKERTLRQRIDIECSSAFPQVFRSSLHHYQIF
jgi:hypothetical protein